MIQINKKLTPYNYNQMANKKNEYIVVHYVGSESTAKNNADYFANNKLQSSAHYFVDSTSIWQSVEDKNKAWHCGGGLQGSGGHTFYNKCTNSNSIGIEMCCFKDSAGRWGFTEQTVNNTVELIRYLMNKYNIPIENVIRHYDVTGKICPEPYVDEKKWSKFKKEIAEGNRLTMTQYEELKNEIENLKSCVGNLYKTENDIPDYYPNVREYVNNGTIKGTGDNLNIPELMARTIEVIKRDISK